MLTKNLPIASAEPPREAPTPMWGVNPRHRTRRVMIGNVPVGGDAAVVVQSMCDTDTRDVAATVAQIHGMEAAGCEVVRVAVPDEEAGEAIAKIRPQIKIPLVADIHFD